MSNGSTWRTAAWIQRTGFDLHRHWMLPIDDAHVEVIASGLALNLKAFASEYGERPASTEARLLFSSTIDTRSMKASPWRLVPGYLRANGKPKLVYPDDIVRAKDGSLLLVGEDVYERHQVRFAKLRLGPTGEGEPEPLSVEAIRDADLMPENEILVGGKEQYFAYVHTWDDVVMAIPTQTGTRLTWLDAGVSRTVPAVSNYEPRCCGRVVFEPVSSYLPFAIKTANRIAVA